MDNKTFAAQLAWAVSKKKIKTVADNKAAGWAVTKFIYEFGDKSKTGFDPDALDVSDPTPEIKALAGKFASVKKENPKILDMFSRIREESKKTSTIPTKKSGFSGPEW